MAKTYLQEFCSRCKHFDSKYGACTLLQIKVQSNRSAFEKKCNGRLFELAEGAADFVEEEPSTDETAPESGIPPELAKRNPWLAGLLSLLVPGFGQIYNGQLKKGIALFLSGVFCAIFLFTAGLPSSFIGLIAMLLIASVLWIYNLLDAILTARETKLINPKPYHKWYVYLTYYIFAVIIASFYVQIFRNSYEAYRVPTGAMENTILVGDYIMTDNRYYRKHEPATGDILVFRYPRQPNLSYIKRCVGTPGQLIEIRQKKMYVDGEPFQEPPAVKFKERTLPPGVREREIFSPLDSAWNHDNYGPLRVPEGSYLVIGDNRDNSADSRYWGFLPRENIVGKAIYIYYSWDKHGSKIRWGRLGMKVK